MPLTKFDPATLQAKLATLPKWARDYLTDLRSKLEAALDSLAAVPKTQTWWGWPQGLDLGRPHGYIPDDETVRFSLGDGHSWVEIRREKGLLKFYGSHAFIVAVQSSNVLHVTVDRKGVFY